MTKPCVYADLGTCAGAVVLYPSGHKCATHRPPAPPVPDPTRTLEGLRLAAGLRPDAASPMAPTLVDTRAVASGKRRSQPSDYRAARADIERHRQ